MPRVEKSMVSGKTSGAPEYRLRLFVSGATPKAREAIANMKNIIDKHLKGRCVLEVIDALQQSELLRGQQIVVLPTLIKELPPPVRRLIGDLSDEDAVLAGLGLLPRRRDSEVRRQ
jgi:circadian clock protein KaiB